MYKSSGNQDTSAEMLGTKKKRRRYAETRKLDDKDWKGTTSRGYKQDEKQTADMECEVVVRLRGTGFTCASTAKAVDGRLACGWSTHDTGNRD
jgi:hypothetical protein